MVRACQAVLFGQSLLAKLDGIALIAAELALQLLFAITFWRTHSHWFKNRLRTGTPAL
jgi:ABC-type Mn2+/Zn2+ transport system permease subunit